jgi:hypothetical protein
MALDLLVYKKAMNVSAMTSMADFPEKPTENAITIVKEMQINYAVVTGETLFIEFNQI